MKDLDKVMTNFSEILGKISYEEGQKRIQKAYRQSESNRTRNLTELAEEIAENISGRKTLTKWVR